MTDLSLFSFDGCRVRVVLREGAPWFVLADVCRVLGIANSRDAASRLDDDEKADVGIADTSSNGVEQRRLVTIINESGLYALILTSRKPQARRFRKWVTAEVLPALRRTGHYALPDPAPVPMAAGEGLPAAALLPPDPEDARIWVAAISLCYRVHGRQAAREMWRVAPLWQPAISDTEQARTDADSTGIPAFLADRVAPCPGARLAAGTLYADYSAWCDRAQVVPVSPTAFGRWLVTQGFRKVRCGNVFYRDVRLRDAAA